MEEVEIVPTKHSITESSSVGTRLRHARERRGWSQQEAAQMLCLNVNTITALERDDFETVGANVFVRGYLQNYVKLLRLPLAEFSLQTTSFAPPRKTTTKTASRCAQAFAFIGHLTLRLFNYGIVILLALLVFIWWHDRYHANETANLPTVLKMSLYQTPFPAMNLFSPPRLIEKPMFLSAEKNAAIACWQQTDPDLLMLMGETHGE